MRSKVENKPETKKTDYYFLLKCMAGLTAAAFVTAGVLAVVAAKTSTTAGAAGLLAASSAVAGPIGALAAMAAIAAILAAACILPCLFGVGGNSVAYVSSRPSYRPWWQPTPFLYSTTPSVVHTHGGSIFGGSRSSVHTHSSSAPVHTHGGSIFGSSAPVHTHGGSIFGGSAPVHTHGGSIFGGSNSHSHHDHGSSSHGHSGATVHRHG